MRYKEDRNKTETIASHDPTHKRITVKEFIKNLQRCPLDANIQIESNVLVEDVTTWKDETKWVRFTHNAHKLKKDCDHTVRIEISTPTMESSGY
jgi:hypothetical protein